jgi:hypothetical protein
MFIALLKLSYIGCSQLWLVNSCIWVVNEYWDAHPRAPLGHWRLSHPNKYQLERFIVPNRSSQDSREKTVPD